ncbi:MAG: LysE family translocator [Ectothiorhodospiraceae bacterium]|nr:LysE family translocator [Ectothiorhodospiraceae bacterium]MCH8502829.1 LysE family translocator [Ectothiorhodospiraceae bacterium]
MELYLFIAALVAVYLVPGPDMILVLQTGIARGRTLAFATVAGLASARGLHVTFAALGLAAMFRAAPGAFLVVRIVGACYMLWLAMQMLRSEPVPRDACSAPAAGMARSYRAAWRRGLLTNLLNPKSLLFCSVLLPQFIQPDQSLLPQFLGLGIILVGIGILFDLMYATAGARMGEYITASPGLQRAQRWLFATLLAGFGMRLALDVPVP